MTSSTMRRASWRDLFSAPIGEHIVLGLPAPYPANVAQWVTDELITTSAKMPVPR